MAVFVKKKPGRRAKKSYPSNSRSALSAQALRGRAWYQRQGQLHAFIRDKLIAWVGFWVHGTMNLSTEILEVDRLIVLVLEVVVEETLGPLGCTIQWNSHTQGNGHLRLLRRRPGTCTLLVTIYYALVQELNRVLVSLRIPGIVKKTLPKAQRTRGLSSSCQSHIASSNTNLDRISSSESWLSINKTSASPLNLKFKILTQPSFRISTKIQLHNLYKTSAAKCWTSSSFKILLNFNFKILTNPCAQSLKKV